MAGVSAQTMPLAVAFLIIGTCIMWLSARIVAVPKATMGRSFLATLGVSLIMGAAVTAWSQLGAIGLALVVAGIIGSIVLLKRVFEVPATPAALIFIVNVMVQVLLVAMWLRPFVQKAAGS